MVVHSFLRAARADRVRSFAAFSLVASSMFVTAHAAESMANNQQAATGHGGAEFILDWDDDGDGKVPRAEYDDVRTKRFAGADADHGDTLTLDEYVKEYVARLDVEMDDEKKASIKQTHTRFRAIDTDKDTFISRAEYDASGVRAFEHLDADHDGRISEQDPPEKAMKNVGDEQQPRRRRASTIRMPTTHNRVGFFEIYDTDGDGVVTQAQFDSARSAAFSATDTSADGKLDGDEYLQEFMVRLEQQIKLRREELIKQAAVRFKSIDEDKNGSISRAEYFAMSARMFARADTNKDGVITDDDPPASRREAQASATSTAAAATSPAKQSSR